MLHAHMYTDTHTEATVAGGQHVQIAAPRTPPTWMTRIVTSRVALARPLFRNCASSAMRRNPG